MASVVRGSTSPVPAFQNLRAQRPPWGPEPRLFHQSLLSAVKTEQQPQERQQLTVQRSEEVSRVLSQVNGFQVQRAAKALRREYVRCIKRRARKQVCLKRCVAGEGREFGKQAGRRAWGVWEDPLGHYNGFGFYFANENFKQRTDIH